MIRHDRFATFLQTVSVIQEKKTKKKNDLSDELLNIKEKKNVSSKSTEIP